MLIKMRFTEISLTFNLLIYSQLMFFRPLTFTP